MLTSGLLFRSSSKRKRLLLSSQFKNLKEECSHICLSIPVSFTSWELTPDQLSLIAWLAFALATSSVRQQMSFCGPWRETCLLCISWLGSPWPGAAAEGSQLRATQSINTCPTASRTSKHSRSLCSIGTVLVGTHSMMKRIRHTWTAKQRGLPAFNVVL